MSILVFSVAFATILSIEEAVERWKVKHTRVRVYRAHPRRFG